MSKTAFTTNSELTKKLWSEKLYRDAKKEAYFSRFMGEGENNIIQTNTMLKKSAGDRIRFGIAMRLTGSGVTSGQTLEGNEESLTTYYHDVTLEQYRHAVRDRGALDRQRAMFSIDEVSKSRLMDWASEKIDALLFSALSASPTKAFYGGTATSTATLTASDKLTPALLSKAKAWAITGGNRTQPPLRPVKVDGKNYYVVVIHPDVAYDFGLDSTFLQARREAEVRGKENPIFSGSYMIWDGMVIHVHENVEISTTYGSGSNVAGAKCLFLGAQAGVWAEGGIDGNRPTVIAEQFDYGNEHGFAWEMIAAASKPVFNSKDYGMAAIYVARTQIADA